MGPLSPITYPPFMEIESQQILVRTENGQTDAFPLLTLGKMRDPTARKGQGQDCIRVLADLERVIPYFTHGIESKISAGNTSQFSVPSSEVVRDGNFEVRQALLPPGKPLLGCCAPPCVILGCFAHGSTHMRPNSPCHLAAKPKLVKYIVGLRAVTAGALTKIWSKFDFLRYLQNCVF